LDPKRLDFEPMRKIGRFLTDHPGGAILVDGLEHLITVNGLERVLKFVKKVNDIASLSQATLLVSLSPKSLGAEDLSRLRKEFDKALGPGEAAPQAVVA
jgi:archaellum biogenesis ATPase FlaH